MSARPIRVLGMRLFMLSLLVAAAGCKDKPADANAGLPAAQNWSAPQPAPSSAREHGGANDPSGGMGMGGGDPHAGMDMGGADPHAGMDVGGDDPHAGMDMGGDPRMAAVQPPDPDRAIDESKFLKGTITPTAETKDKFKVGATVFVSVKPIDPNTDEVIGAAVAVDKLTIVGSSSLEFHLTERNAMRAGTEFSGDVLVIAWVDSDGDAISKLPGDVQGQVKAKIPADGLTLSLDTVLQ